MADSVMIVNQINSVFCRSHQYLGKDEGEGHSMGSAGGTKQPLLKLFKCVNIITIRAMFGNASEVYILYIYNIYTIYIIGKNSSC